MTAFSPSEEMRDMQVAMVKGVDVLFTNRPSKSARKSARQHEAKVLAGIEKQNRVRQQKHEEIVRMLARSPSH